MLELCGGVGTIGVPRLSGDHRARTRAQRSAAASRRRACASPRYAGRDAGPRHRAGDGSSRIARRAVRRCTSGEVERRRGYLDIALDGSDGELVHRPTCRGLCPRQARSVLRGARPRRGGRYRGRISRIHLGMFASGRRPVRGHNAGVARGPVLRPRRLDGSAGLVASVSRRAAGPQVLARTHVACLTRYKPHSISRVRHSEKTASMPCRR